MSMLDQKQFISSALAHQSDLHAVNPYFLGVQPGTDFFERYGISGCSSVLTRRGHTTIEDVMDGDELVSRTFGFVKPTGVLRSVFRPRSKNAPGSVMVGSGFFKSSCPQSDVIVGNQVEIHAPIAEIGAIRPRMTSFDMATNGHLFANYHGTRPRLFIPIFPEQTSIQVQGIYVVCPSIDDLAAEFSHPSKKQKLN